MANEEFPQLPLPAFIIPDKGVSLTSDLAKGLLASLGVEMCATSPFQIEHRRQVERTFRLINNSLDKGLTSSDPLDKPDA